MMVNAYGDCHLPRREHQAREFAFANTLTSKVFYTILLCRTKY